MMVSSVWKYFKKDGNTVICSLCANRLSHNSSSTGTMINHLRIKHPTVKLESTDTKNQPSVATMFTDINKRKTCDKQRSEKITDLIMNFLIENMLPFQLADSESFHNLVNFFEPAYTIPSRVTFSNKVMKQYEDCKNNLKQSLETVYSVSLTTDSWMSMNSQSFTTVTGHFITSPEWQMKSVVLATVHKQEDHTALNIQQQIDEVISDFHIENKVAACVHDNAANVVRGVMDSSFIELSLNCVAHSLQLSINKGLNEIDVLKTSVGAGSRLVGHFKHSYKASNYLSAKQTQMELPEHKLIQKCSTRWNSTLDMFERLLEQRWAISAVLSDRRCTKLSEARTLQLKDCHWRIIESMIPVLQPLKVATTAVSYENDVSLSCVTPIIISLVQNHLKNEDNDDQIVRNFKKIVTEDLQKRFAELFQCKNCDHENISPYIIATFLDPKHKHFPFFSKEEKDAIFKCIVQIVEKENPIVPFSENEAGESKKQKVEAKNENENGLSFLLGADYTRDSSTVTILQECENYLSFNTSLLDVKDEVLGWWKQNQTRFPRLAKLAQKYLATPATSVPSERMFSAAGRLVTKLRNRLSVKNSDMILFLYKNKNKLTT